MGWQYSNCNLLFPSLPPLSLTKIVPSEFLKSLDSNELLTIFLFQIAKLTEHAIIPTRGSPLAAGWVILSMN